MDFDTLTAVVRGNAGCNEFSAAFAFDGAQLSLNDLIATAARCDRRGLDIQRLHDSERRLIDILGRGPLNLRLRRNSFVLRNADGDTLFARRDRRAEDRTVLPDQRGWMAR